jgi:hypothetical protein
MQKALAVLVGLILAGLGAAPAAFAAVQVSTPASMPVELRATVDVYDCHNSPGPRITFEPTLTLGGVTVALIFRNNINKDVHTRQEDVQLATGVAAGAQIVIPKQPVLGGVGGNPFIWLQLVDTNGAPLTAEIFLGRCVQGAVVETPFATPTTATAVVEALDCTNNPGPWISAEGSLSFFPGVQARFIFRNNDNPVGGPHEADGFVDLTLVNAGFTVRFPKQPVLGGVGGNPWISTQFLDGSGQAIGDEFLLGRCVQLLPGN